jgi:hypothetical protein
MSGLASRGRYFAYAWMTEPKPGELEYLGWQAHRQTVNSDTLVNHGARHNYAHERQIRNSHTR